jgi:hypothetical protein
MPANSRWDLIRRLRVKGHDFSTRPHQELKCEVRTFTDNSVSDFRGGQRVLVELSMWMV